LWSWWGGVSVIGAGGVGGTTGTGVAYDSNNGGFGGYSTGGPAYGLAGSAGVETGFYTGDLENASQVYTVGIGPWSVGLVLDEDGWDMVGGASLSLPIEFTYSEPHTSFEPIQLFQPDPDPCQ